MKKSLVIICMTIGVLGLMAIGLVSKQENEIEISEKTDAIVNRIEETLVSRSEQPIAFNDFALDVGTRFIATISKEDLDKAVSISEIIPRDANWNQYFINKTHVRIENFDLETGVAGDGLILNEPQLALIKSTKYSDNLQFGAEHATSWKSGSLNYMVSIVPEKQAEYIDGHDQLISYLRDNSSTIIKLWQNNQWRDGKINFTVDQLGSISSVNLISTSGNLTVDQQMVRLISETTNKWLPAENSKGEKVEQVLTFSFGSIGC